MRVDEAWSLIEAVPTCGAMRASKNCFGSRVETRMSFFGRRHVRAVGEQAAQYLARALTRHFEVRVVRTIRLGSVHHFEMGAVAHRNADVRNTAGRDRTYPNQLIVVLYAGALALAIGVIALGLGFLGALS
jgi:hypothetical protein